MIGQKAQKLSMWMVQEGIIQQQPKCHSQVKIQPWILQKFIPGFLLVTKLLPHHLLTGILPGARLGAWGCSVGRWPSLLGAEIIGFFKAKREHRDKSINMKKTTLFSWSCSNNPVNSHFFYNFLNENIKGKISDGALSNSFHFENSNH